MNTILRFSIWVLCIFMLKADDTLLNVRVLLGSFPIDEQIGIELYSENGLVITGSREQNKKYFFDDLATVSIKNKNIFINQKQNDSQILRVTPVNGHTEFNSNTYGGTFYLYRTAKTLDIINILPLEDYIYCVLRTEGWPGWPKEVYKVFSVACRSYVLYQIQQARKLKRHYHICATNSHQTYSGTHTTISMREAVNETTGIFLAYKNEPILAMFDACCGGIIPAHVKNGISFTEAPYLARTYACNYCKSFKIYSWSKEYSLNTFKTTLQKLLPELKTIYDIETKTDRAGTVQKIVISENNGQRHIVEGKKIYSLFPSVKSFAFTCTKKHNKIVLDGYGYGHHLGLCQWGAYYLVDQENWSYKKVLRFYYPDTTFMKLCKKNKTKPEASSSDPTAEQHHLENTTPVHEVGASA